MKNIVQQKNYLSRSLAVMAFATVRRDSLYTLGYILCWKQCIWTLMCTYLRRILLVSSWVLKEFIRTSGMLHPYFLFKCWNIKIVIIIWHFYSSWRLFCFKRWLWNNFNCRSLGVRGGCRVPPPSPKKMLLKNYCLLIERYLSKMNFKPIDGLHQSYWHFHNLQNQQKTRLAKPKIWEVWS